MGDVQEAFELLWVGTMHRMSDKYDECRRTTDDISAPTPPPLAATGRSEEGRGQVQYSVAEGEADRCPPHVGQTSGPPIPAIRDSSVSYERQVHYHEGRE